MIINMNLTYSPKKLSQSKADCEVVLVSDRNLKHKWVRDAAVLRQLDYKGEDGEAVYLPDRKRIYVGIASLDYDEIRQGSAAAIRQLKKYRIKSLKIGLYGDDPAAGAQAAAEGFILGGYEFDEFKKEKAKNNISRIVLAADAYKARPIDPQAVREGIKAGKIIGESVNYARDLVNLPTSALNSVELAERAKRLAKEIKAEARVYGKDFLEKEGMGAFLAVNQASACPPRLIHLSHRPAKADKRIVLVGKGLTYDTGGLSLKPTKGMVLMKMDMGGAGAVLGIFRAAVLLGLPLEIHAIIGATDNAIGRHAYRPGDILRSRSGQTIEVKNTDAEGRLVLADCLNYAQDLEPDYILDLATLTGACLVGLGHYTIGALGYNEDLIKTIVAEGKASGEQAAWLPFNKYIKKSLKSKVADISNISQDEQIGGAISAGMFLGAFIDKKYRDNWVHLDIAGPSLVDKPWGYHPYGASGSGVRLILRWLENSANK